MNNRMPSRYELFSEYELVLIRDSLREWANHVSQQERLKCIAMSDAIDVVLDRNKPQNDSPNPSVR